MKNYVRIPTIEEISAVVRNEVEAALKNHRRHMENQDKMMTRQDVADYLNITLPTVHSYMNQGILKPYKISGRTLFKKSEVTQALTKVG